MYGLTKFKNSTVTGIIDIKYSLVYFRFLVFKVKTYSWNGFTKQNTCWRPLDRPYVKITIFHFFFKENVLKKGVTNNFMICILHSDGLQDFDFIKQPRQKSFIPNRSWENTKPTTLLTKGPSWAIMTKCANLVWLLWKARIVFSTD